MAENGDVVVSSVKSSVDVPQSKMGGDELDTFMRGFDNLASGMEEMSKYDFSSESTVYEYTSGFARDESGNKRSERSSEGNDAVISFLMNPSCSAAKSSLGRYLPNFRHYCDVCGKEIGSNEKWGEYIKMVPFNGGFCSFKCATQAAMDLVLNNLVPTMRQDKGWLDDIQATLNFINTLCNMVGEIPYVVQSLSRLPDVYHNYVMQKLFIVFNLLRILVNKTMRKKNSLIISMLKKVKNGSFGSDILGAMEWINTAIGTVNTLADGFEKGYGIASLYITEALKQFCLPAEGMGFFMTTRSMIASPGKFLLPVDKNGNAKGSVLDSVNIEKVMDYIKISLPPIQEPEYFLDPDSFELRYILSSDNYKLVAKYAGIISDILRFGADYLPEYKNLTPINPYFMFALVYGWCPATQVIFGKELGTEIPALAASYNAKIAAQT